MTKHKIILMHAGLFLLSSVVFALCARWILDVIISDDYSFGTYMEFIVYGWIILFVTCLVSCRLYLKKRHKKQIKFTAIKRLNAILIVSLLILFFKNTKKDIETTGDLKFNDIPLDFQGSIFHIDSSKEILQCINDVKFSGVYKRHDWYRNKDHLLLLHNVLKKIGYKNVLPEEELSKPIDNRFNKHWGNISYKQLVDSFLVTKNLKNISSDSYFKAFWKRREREGNDIVLFKILTEIQSIYKSNIVIPVNYLPDDQSLLYELIFHNVKLINEDDRDGVIEYFMFLKRKHLNFSASKFILENTYLSTSEKDSLLLTLPAVSETEFNNQSSWFINYYDGGS